jgi:ribosome biogenesis GTPase
MAAEASRAGLVVALEANFCRVQLEQPGPAHRQQLLCVRRTRLGKTGQQICVGDRVQVEGIDWPAGRGAVAAVAERSSLLERPAVANCSTVVVAVALAQPALDPLQLTRFLLSAEATGVAVQLVLTKADLLEEPEREHWRQRLEGWGYAPLLVSCRRGDGLEELRRCLAEPGIAVLCGPSGVGKSSLINALLPQLQLRVSAVSGRLQRGRHTTRHVELFALADGALLADTPGFNRPDLPRDPQALAVLFPEIRQRLQAGACRFSNCLHQGDPGCAVGESWERYSHYRSCLETVLADAVKARAGRPERAEAHPAQQLPQQLPQRLRQLSRRRLRQSEDE